MNTEIDQKGPGVESHGGDPFALTENCDYYPPSKVSAKSSLHVVGTRLRHRIPRDVPPRNLASAPAQTFHQLPERVYQTHDD